MGGCGGAGHAAEECAAPPSPTRRSLLATTALASLLTPRLTSAAAVEAPPPVASTPAAALDPPPLPPFTSPGPYAPRRLPALDHVCADLAPACTAPAQCSVTLELWVPGRQGGEASPGPDRGGLRPATPRRAGADPAGPAPPHQPPPRPHPSLPSGGPPFPLAVITGGFLVGRAAYASLAAHLAGWGFAALVYDRGGESALNPVDDLLAADVLLSVLDFMEASPALSQVAATRTRSRGGGGGGGGGQAVPGGGGPSTILVGHSRGAKVSVLAAARDFAAASAAGTRPRIAALGLLDPVNVTRYAPQSPRFPSATAALVGGPPQLAGLPIAIVGGGWAHDCAPADANYDTFYAASRGPTWMTVLPGAGHFQFVGTGFGARGGGGGGGGGEGSGPAASAPPPPGAGAPFLQRALCAEGPASGEAVRAAAAGALTAWSLAVLGGGVGGSGGGGGSEAAAGQQAPPPPATRAATRRRPTLPPAAPPSAPFPTADWLDAAEGHMRAVLGGEAAVLGVRKGIPV